MRLGDLAVKGMQMGSEKRIHEIIYLSSNLEVLVNLSISGTTTTIQAKIMNLSEGGMALSYRRSQTEAINQGQILFIHEVSGAGDLKCIENKMVEARWVLDNEGLETVGVGCQFYGFTDTDKRAIKQFIEQHAQKYID